MKNHNIDKVKAIACYLVCLNHFHPNGRIGEIIYIISHCGVPVFFFVSGYFFMDKNNEINPKRLIKKTKHIGLLFMVHIIIYAAFEIITKLLNGYTLTNVFRDLAACFGIKSLVKTIVLGTGFMGGGEWFLASLLDAYIVLGLLFQSQKIRNFFLKSSHIIAIILFLIHIFGRIIIVKIGITNLLGISLLESYSVRNTWLDTIPFMCVGIAAKNHKTIQVKYPALMAFVAITASVLENFIIVDVLNLSKIGIVLYVGTICAVCITMKWAIQSPGNESKLSVIGAQYSMLIYFLHPIIGRSLQEVLAIVINMHASVMYEISFSVVVLIVTTVISMGVIKLRSLVTIKVNSVW